MKLNVHTHTHTHTHNVSNKLPVIPGELEYKALCHIILEATYTNTYIRNVSQIFANMHAITCFCYQNLIFILFKYQRVSLLQEQRQEIKLL
jgi:hypothetical protein